MEIGLKERLIGAVVLVLLAIIIIPWLLKGPAPDTSVSQPVTLPPAVTTAAAQEVTMPLAGTAVPAASGTPVPAVASKAPVAAAVSTPKSAAPAKPPAPVAQTIQRQSAVGAPAAGKWVVQAGSYGSEANAGIVAHKLQEHGFHAFISRFDKGGHAYFRVRVGPYADRTAAERAASGVARASGVKAEVTPNS